MTKAFAENDRELETCRGQISEPTEKDFNSISLFSVSRGVKVVQELLRQLKVNKNCWFSM
jgi:hypothetical protein